MSHFWYRNTTSSPEIYNICSTLYTSRGCKLHTCYLQDVTCNEASVDVDTDKFVCVQVLLYQLLWEDKVTV